MQNRIRILRAERQWSQADLAARVGVSRNSINAVENGRFDPSLPLAKLRTLNEVIGESVAEESFLAWLLGLFGALSLLLAAVEGIAEVAGAEDAPVAVLDLEVLQAHERHAPSREVDALAPGIGVVSGEPRPPICSINCFTVSWSFGLP